MPPVKWCSKKLPKGTQNSNFVYLPLKRQKTPSQWCGKCRSVHDLKKKFDYRPVRAKVQELIRRIQNHLQSKTEQLFPLEIIVNELCIHKGELLDYIDIYN